MKKILFGFVALSILTSCSTGVKDSMGLSRGSPDEFSVVSNPPLTIPPDFSLRAPSKGNGDFNVNSDVKNPLSRNVVTNISSKSEADEVFLRKAGIEEVRPNIKQQIEAENIQKEEEINKSFFSKLYKYKKKTEEEKIVDPYEQKKLLEDVVRSSKSN